MRKSVGISMTENELALLDKIAELDKRDRSSVVVKAFSEYARHLGVD